MRSKTPLVLTELLIMLLVFLLAAGLCLQAFFWADQVSRDSARADLAIAAAQNAAELTRHYAGDLEAAAADHGGTWNGEVWTVTLDNCQVTVTLLPSPNPYLGSAQICAEDAVLTVAWQKEAADE